MYLHILLGLNESESRRLPNLRIVQGDEGKCPEVSECKKTFALSQQRGDNPAQDRKNIVHPSLHIWVSNSFSVRCHLKKYETWYT